MDLLFEKELVLDLLSTSPTSSLSSPPLSLKHRSAAFLTLHHPHFQQPPPIPLLCLDQENKKENPDQENLGENRQQLVFSCSENGGESGPPIRKMQLDWITPPAEFCNRPVFAFKDSRCPYLFSPRLGSLASIFRCICHCLFVFAPTCSPPRLGSKVTWPPSARLPTKNSPCSTTPPS